MEKEHINYYRQEPIRNINTNDTMYRNIRRLNRCNLDNDALGFLGYNDTFRGLFSNVERLADGYSKIGIKEGNSVGILSINMPLVQENLLACSKLGATSVWLDLRTKEKDLIQKINETGCQVLVIFDELTPLVEKILSKTDVKKVLVASPKDYLNPFVKILANIKDKKDGKNIIMPENNKFIRYQQFLKTGDIHNNIKPVKFERDRISIIAQSSGSTGISKSIAHTEYNFNSSMQKESFSDLPLRSGGTLYNAIPPFVIYGLNNAIYVSLSFGLKCEMTPFVSEETLFNDLGKFDITLATCAPLHYRYIYTKMKKLMKDIEELEKENSSYSKKELSKCLKELNKIFDALKRVRVFVTGGDKVTAQEILNWQHLFAVPCINGYGNNEVNGAAVISPVYASKPGSVGIPMKGIEVAAFNDEKEKLPINQEGELCILSDSSFVKYINNDEETKEVKQSHKDGSLQVHTGDLGYVDEDGFVYVTGRIKRLIKRAAFKIAPITIEKELQAIPFINDCVVVGVPDEKEIEVPMAFIELKEGLEESFEELKDKIIEQLKDVLPDYELPKYVLRKEKIPYNNGKQAFKLLEEEGANYVNGLNNKTLKLTIESDQ